MPRKHIPQDPTLPTGFNITFRDRFWKKVTKTCGCWLWHGAKTSAGRGAIFTGTRQIDAHVGSWVLHFGNVPEGKFVLHTCDIGLCVRPDHLWLGTQADNSRDACAKRRHYQTFSWEEVGEMRTLYKNGCTTRRIAEIFGIAKSTVWRVVANNYPKHKPNDAKDIPPPIAGMGRTRMPSGTRHHNWKHGRFATVIHHARAIE